MESWSMYSLKMEGDEPLLTQLPESDLNGKTNITCALGTVRFWFRPNWSSRSLGGDGPGEYGRLIEFGAWSKNALHGWWSLYLDPLGDAIYFSGQSGGLDALYFKAGIQWNENEWHQIAVSYSPKSSALYIDGQLVVTGDGVTRWPDANVRAKEGICIGSDLSGGNLAQGEFDELITFDYVSKPEVIAQTYRWSIDQVVKGPITPEEEQRNRENRRRGATGSSKLMFSAASGPPEPPGGGGGGGGGSDPTNPPPYSVPGLKISIPKFVNQSSEIAFWVLEPEANIVYEVQFATNLTAPIAWTAVARGLAGQTNFVISNPWTENGFFRLRVPGLAGPQYLLVPEDTSYLISTFQVGGFTGSVGTVSLRVTNGFLKITTTNGLTLSGNVSSNLVATGTQAALNTAMVTLRYQGKTNFYGPDGLFAMLTNAGPATNLSETLRISITVTPENDHPLTTTDAYSIPENTTLNVAAPGVLANDFDQEINQLFAVLVSSTSHGDLTLQGDGSLIYIPAPNYVGSDSFTYRASDGDLGNIVTVGITVTAVNDPPTISITSPTNGASLAVGASISLAVNVSDSDGTISGVNYYRGTTLIASSSSSPFSATWANPGPGAYTITAKATDDSGAIGVSPPVTFSVSPDCDGDGVSDAIEISQGTDPCDYFNGVVPLLTIVSGNFQAGPANSVLPQRLTVRAFSAAGNYYSNSPVSFSVTTGSGSISTSTNGPWTNSVSVATDASGLASIACRLPSGGLTLVQASVGSNASLSTVIFGEVVAGPDDTWVLPGNPAAISAGFAHTLALTMDGRVWGWGANGSHQLSSNITNYLVTSPVQLPGISNMVAIAAGGSHSMTLKNDGTVSTWGEYVEVGSAAFSTNLPSAIAIAAGLDHCLVLLSDGTVRAWGSPFTAFTPPTGLNGVVTIAAGHDLSLALKNNGTVAAWGNGPYSVAYNFGATNVPSSLTNAQAIAAGAHHALAMRSNGTVTAWGYNSRGQASVPSGLSNVVAIAAGEEHSLALLADGTVKAWGDTNSAQVGQLSGLTGVTAIYAGGRHSVALKSDGTIRAWGTNTFGQLGNGTQTHSSTPVQVSGFPRPATTNYGVQFKVFTPLK